MLFGVDSLGGFYLVKVTATGDLLDPHFVARPDNPCDTPVSDLIAVTTHVVRETSTLTTDDSECRRT